MWRQVVAQSPGENAPTAEILRYDIGWKALNTMLKAGRSLSGHERNCCFLNTRGQRFADVSAAASIDFDDDGRVLALVDWDFDGDLDFWIANRTGPQIRFLRNDASKGKNYIAFKLEGVNCNRDAIGARVELHLPEGESRKRFKTLRAGEGYLAQSSKWVSFGLGDVQGIEKIVVKWPDGTQETIGGLQVNQRYAIRQAAGEAEKWTPPKRTVDLRPSKIEVPPSTDKSRIVLISPLPLPSIKYEDQDSTQQIALNTPGRPRLINLWATWCQPCIKELSEWKSHAPEFQQKGLDVVTINVDEPAKDREQQQLQIKKMFASLQLPFHAGFGTESLVNQFDAMQRSILRRQKSLPVPSSFLIDARGNLRVIYKGPVDANQILKDADLLTASAEKVVAASVPYEGIWLGQPAGTSPNTLAVRYVEGGYLDEAVAYIQQLANSPIDNPMYKPTEAMVLLGAIYTDQRKYEEAAAAFRAALKVDPNHRQSHIELARVLGELNQHAEAVMHFEAALERRQNDPELRYRLALALSSSGQQERAAEELENSIEYRPSALAHHQLGNAYIALGRIDEAVKQFELALKMDQALTLSRNNLAWLLATDESVMDGPRAVELAERLVNSGRGRTAGNLDTLAAAYAADDRFDDAVRSAEEAIKLATAERDAAKAQRIEKRLALYRQQLPYRE